MNKIEYLKLCVLQKVLYHTDWWFSVFCVSTSDRKTPTYDYELFSFEWGYGFYDPTTKELVKISDAKAGVPLFSHTERVKVDPTWASNITEPFEASIGNIVGNALVLEYAFGSKYPFPRADLSIQKVENVVAPLLTDTPEPGATRDPSKYYVDEYVKFRDALQTLKITSAIFSVSATPKNILPPTGIKEFKINLDKEYEGRLDDPIVLAEYEAKLKAFDADYMRDDPSFGPGRLISGKVQNMARKKLHLTLGQESLRFDDSVAEPTISKSLNQGWPDPNTDKKQYVANINSMRIGSFARGAETVKGGVAAKHLARAGSDYSVKDEDCGVAFGVVRYYNSSNIKSLIGSYVIGPGGKTTLVEDNNMSSYVDKVVQTRSPAFCRTKGDYICRKCAGEKLFMTKDGMTIPMMEISSIMLAASMSAMHGKVLSVAQIDIERHLL